MTVAGIETWNEDFPTPESNWKTWIVTDLKTSLLTILLNKYVITTLVVAVSSLFLGAIAVFQSQAQLTQSPVDASQVDARNCDATQIACLNAIRSEAQNQLRNTQLTEAAKITQFDLNPENPIEMGLMQRVLNNEAIAFNARVQQVRGDRNDPNYGLHPEAIRNNSTANAVNKIALGAGGETSTLVWNDPGAFKTDETGKPVLDENGLPQPRQVYEKMSPHMTQVIGIVQLLTINSSRNSNIPQSDSVPIALDLINGQEDIKNSVVALLRLQGLDQVASQIEQQDMYGRKVVPSITEQLQENSQENFQENSPDFYNPFPGGL
ncbi:hypothetical protein [Laspinema olomoucense]|uniref:hypothetical protein n=1 Tax=Laspinema olomoucense TaxID=3231600 RepID=UPI0021BB10A1|nr:hypothetical protein [Laspinema sp. D3d]MCT7971132.1 hypothetical protein [Laspinema sp. D3d]